MSSPYPLLITTQKLLTRYGYPFIATVGCLGNLLNIFLLSRKTLRTISCNTYLLASSFVNLVIIMVGIVPIVNAYDRPWLNTAIYCKLRSYLINASQQISRFLIVAACFDRFALCSTSVRLRQFCRVQVAVRYTIPSIIVLWLVMPIYMLIFNNSINNACTYVGAAALYNSIYGITLVGFTPPLLMLIFSLLTFRNLKVKRQRQQVRLFAMTNHRPPALDNRNRRRRDQQVLAMLMVQVVVYVSTTTTSSVNLLYSMLTAYVNVSKLDQPVFGLSHRYGANVLVLAVIAHVLHVNGVSVLVADVMKHADVDVTDMMNAVFAKDVVQIEVVDVDVEVVAVVVVTVVDIVLVEVVKVVAVVDVEVVAVVDVVAVVTVDVDVEVVAVVDVVAVVAVEVVDVVAVVTVVVVLLDVDVDVEVVVVVDVVPLEVDVDVEVVAVMAVPAVEVVDVDPDLR